MFSKIWNFWKKISFWAQNAVHQDWNWIKQNPWLAGILPFSFISILGISLLLSPAEMDDPTAAWRNIILTAAAPITFYLAIWRSIVADRQREVAELQREVAEKNRLLAERGQTIDRYQKGADMLGSDNIAVRQAGVITLLELLKQDQDDYGETIVDILCGFVRAWRPGVHSDSDEKPNETRNASKNTMFNDNQTPRDVISAIHGLCGLGSTQIKLQQTLKQQVDFSGAYLIGLNLDRAIFHGADFSGAHISDSSFEGAQLESVLFKGAMLKSNLFPHSRMADVDFRNSTLHNVVFTNSALNDINLKTAKITNCLFDKVVLNVAHFCSAKLANSDFFEAELGIVDFSKTAMYESKFQNTMFSYSGFNGATFEKVTFIGSMHKGSRFDGLHRKVLEKQGLNVDDGEMFTFSPNSDS